LSQKPKDLFFNVKKFAYSLARLPRNADFVQHCKFVLCVKNKVLMKDPVWNDYTAEEILIEYYAHVFTADQKEAERFLTQMQGEDVETLDSFSDWVDRKMNENKVDLNQKSEELESSVSFDPTEDVLGG
jgi:hypothetical protein